MGASSFLASFYLVCGIIIFFLAVMILRQSGKSAASWFTALVLFFASFGPILGAVSFLLRRNPREGTVLFKNLVASFDYVWEFFFPSLVLFALVYPRRHRAWPWIRRIAWMLFLPHLFHLVLLIFLVHRVNPSRMFQGLGRIRSPLAAANALLERSAGFAQRSWSLLFKAHVQLFAIVDVAYAAFSMMPSRERHPLRRVAARETAGARAARRARALHRHVLARAGSSPALAGRQAQGYVTSCSRSSSTRRSSSAAARSRSRSCATSSSTCGSSRGAAFSTSRRRPCSRPFISSSSRRSRGLLRAVLGRRVEILETGFIILFIIAFQPVLGRIEDWSERFLVREQHDPRARIRALSGELLTMIDVDAMKERIGAVLTERVRGEGGAARLVGEASRRAAGIRTSARSSTRSPASASP